MFRVWKNHVSLRRNAHTAQFGGKSGKLGYLDPRQMVETVRATETVEAYAVVNSPNSVWDFVSQRSLPLR